MLIYQLTRQPRNCPSLQSIQIFQAYNAEQAEGRRLRAELELWEGAWGVTSFLEGILDVPVFTELWPSVSLQLCPSVEVFGGGCTKFWRGFVKLEESGDVTYQRYVDSFRFVAGFLKP